MHREIINPKKGMLIDHINHDTMDNRKQTSGRLPIPRIVPIESKSAAPQAPDTRE
jgi:hypothetical protein